MSDAMGTKSAEVNGTKSKSLRTKRAKVPQTAKEPRTGLFYLLDSPFVYTVTNPKNANSEVRRPSDKDTKKIAGKK